jgi:hypothetical protein
MQLAPATLSTITAILSAQGITATGPQLSALLAPLTGETPPPSLALQPGEEIWLLQGYDQNCDEVAVSDGYLSMETVGEEIADKIKQSREKDHWGHSRNEELTEDDFTVLIVRKTSRPAVEETFKVTFNS